MIKVCHLLLGRATAVAIAASVAAFGSGHLWLAHAQATAGGGDCWIDEATGEHVNTMPTRALYVGDDGHLHSYYIAGQNEFSNPKSGQSFVRNPDGSWIDEATAEHVDTMPTRALYVGDDGHLHSYYHAGQNGFSNPKSGQAFAHIPCPPPAPPTLPVQPMAPSGPQG